MVLALVAAATVELLQVWLAAQVVEIWAVVGVHQLSMVRAGLVERILSQVPPASVMEVAVVERAAAVQASPLPAVLASPDI